MKHQLTQRAVHNELSVPRRTSVHLKDKQFPTLHESIGILYVLLLSLNDMYKLDFFLCHTAPRPYLKHGFVSYPVSGVDVPGHLCQFIGPGRGLPLGAAPLQLLLLLLRVRGRTGHRRLQPGSWCVSLKVREEDHRQLRTRAAAASLRGWSSSITERG